MTHTGYGGMTLAVATDFGSSPTTFFGTLRAHADDNSGYELVAGGTAGVTLGALRHWSRHDGALGVCNGLLIGDLDDDETNELYVATTLGVRKFIRLQNP